MLFNLLQLFFFLENAFTGAKVAKFDIPLNYPGKGLAFSVHRGKTYNSINIFSSSLHRRIILKTPEKMSPTK